MTTRSEHFKGYPDIVPPVVGAEQVQTGPSLSPVTVLTGYWHHPANRFKIVDYRLRWRLSPGIHPVVAVDVWRLPTGWVPVFDLPADIDGRTAGERADSINAHFALLAEFATEVLI